MARPNIAQITAALKKAAERVMKARPPIKRFPPDKLPKGPPPIKGISARQLFRAAPRRVIEKAEEGHVRMIRSIKRKTAKGMGYWFMTATDENGMVRTHIQTIKAKDGATTLDKSKALLFSCDCGYFKFYADYALWKKGASELKYSTNEPPTMTNPRMLAIPCKHLYILCEAIKEEHL